MIESSRSQLTRGLVTVGLVVMLQPMWVPEVRHLEVIDATLSPFPPTGRPWQCWGMILDDPWRET